MLSNLLLNLESPNSPRMLNFIADLAVETNQLSYLINAYSCIGQQLSDMQEYEKAIRLFKKMLKVIWIEGDQKQELKLYEMLALQYFYMQDMQQCKKYQDRALRGKLEGDKSSSKTVTLYLGFRSGDDTAYNRKKVFHGAYVQRTNTNKVSNALVDDYEQILEWIEKVKTQELPRPSIKQVVDDLTNPQIGAKLIRPSTPLMQIPEHKLLSPSDALNDHMLLPTLSVKDAEAINQQKNSQKAYYSYKDRAEKANQRLIMNQARVQLNRQQLKGQTVDYLTPQRERRIQDSIKKNQKIDWATYVQTSMVSQIKPTKQCAYLTHLSEYVEPVLCDHLADKKEKQKEPKPKQKKKNNDWIKDAISLATDKTTKHLILMR